MCSKKIAVAGCCAILAVLAAGDAAAFFPQGGFNEFGQVRYAVWPFQDFDTDNDGLIERGEGLEFRIETGPRGFTPAEADMVKAGFQVWQNVPTSYANFRFVGNIEDPITPGITSPDYLPTVFMQVTTVPEGSTSIQPDPVENILTELGGSITAITLKLYTITDVPVESGGTQVIVPAGNILDCDIVVDANLHRAGEVVSNFGTIDLKASMVASVGTLLGLGYTPLNNLEPYDPEIATGLPIETTALQFTGPDGVPTMIGATPTMFQAYFLTENPDGSFSPGWADLAPDDISGVSWLYPRTDGQEKFFDVSQEARTHTRRGTGIPSSPISGAHIVAWANVTNNEADRRVPLFSTISGLFVRYNNEQLVGKFTVQGLWKQFEIPGANGDLFDATYTLTLNPLTGSGVERQAPPGLTPELVDSLQGALPASYSLDTRGADAFSTNYPSEVFNEFGNIYDIQNNAAGTALKWDFEENKVVSKTTGKALPTMLPMNRPMFGDPNDVCPMNVLEGIGGGEGGVDTGNIDVGDVAGGLGLGTQKLRGFRDDVLLRSAPGTAVVNLYYAVSPALARFLIRHDWAMRGFAGVVTVMEWLMRHWILLVTVALSGALGAGALFRRSRRHSAAAAALLLVAAVALSAAPASANQVFTSTAGMVSAASHIYKGKVLSTTGRWAGGGRIYTDVVVEVQETIKGQANKGAAVSFSVIGGQVGGMAMSASGIPTFTKDEEIILYLKTVAGRGIAVCNGERGKQIIYTSQSTGEKYVVGGSAIGDAALAQDEKAMKAGGFADADGGGSPGGVPVDDYVDYLRAVVRAQEPASE